MLFITCYIQYNVLILDISGGINMLAMMDLSCSPSLFLLSVLLSGAAALCWLGRRGTDCRG